MAGKETALKTTQALFLFGLVLLPQAIFAHGGVFIEDDLCVIQIGFFKAHFTIYQPQTSANEEFCEDIPEVTETLFVLEYMHDSLKQMPVDFRIIKDVTGKGRAARWEDITLLNDIEEHTVYYQRPTTAPDATFNAEYGFKESGDYIGIVTTKQKGNDKIYRAIFPFKVGVFSIGHLPLFIILVLLVQLLYLYNNGSLKRWIKWPTNKN